MPVTGVGEWRRGGTGDLCQRGPVRPADAATAVPGVLLLPGPRARLDARGVAAGLQAPADAPGSAHRVHVVLLAVDEGHRDVLGEAPVGPVAAVRQEHHPREFVVVAVGEEDARPRRAAAAHGEAQAGMQPQVLLDRLDDVVLYLNVLVPFEAVRAGKFNVWSVTSIDEGIALLTGVEAGARVADGAFPPDSVHGRVAQRLAEFAAIADSSTNDEDETTEAAGSS